MSTEVRLDQLTGRFVGGRYRLEALAGQGQFGCVYKARQYLLGEPVRWVAVKIIDQQVASMKQQSEDFADALTVIRLLQAAGTSPGARHIVNVFDIGVEPDIGDKPYVVMEYVEKNLAQVIGDHNLGVGVSRATEVLRQILLGLALMHDADPSVIHRDLKPDNILIGRDGGAKITDFGLATAANIAAGQGAIVYQAPETLRDNVCSPQSDVYGVGLIAWALLTGRHPYEARVGDATDELLTRRALAAQAEPWPVLCEQVPQMRDGAHADLEDWVMRCLSPGLGNRFRSAGDALAQLERALAGRPVRKLALPGRAEVLSDARQDLAASRHQRALESLKELQQRYREDAEIPALIAQALRGLGRGGEAVQDLQRELLRRPSRELRLELADCMEQAGLVQQADALRRAAARKHP